MSKPTTALVHVQLPEAVRRWLIAEWRRRTEREPQGRVTVEFDAATGQGTIYGIFKPEDVHRV